MEGFLHELRADSATIVDSIKETMRLTGAQLGDAKRIVDTSDAWSDQREEHDAFHRDLLDGIAMLVGAEPSLVSVNRHGHDGGAG